MRSRQDSGRSQKQKYLTAFCPERTICQKNLTSADAEPNRIEEKICDLLSYSGQTMDEILARAMNTAGQSKKLKSWQAASIILLLVSLSGLSLVRVFAHPPEFSGLSEMSVTLTKPIDVIRPAGKGTPRAVGFGAGGYFERPHR